MTQTTPPADLLDSLVHALEPIFRLDDLVALSSERALYRAWDRLLKRPIALRAHLVPDGPGRAWFLRENETLAALDHPAIRHVYAAGVAGGFAYRTTNWVDGESLADALRRGPRPIPTAHALVRDLLGAVEHAHARGVIMRRIVPTTLMVEISGRAVITDLRYADWCLALVPAEERGAGGAFVAPEVRAGEAGEPASDVYTVAAIVYYALTGLEPDPDPAKFVPARRVRPAVPAVLDRVLLPSLTADLGVVERFRREAQLAAKLRHPNVVSIYDIMGRAGLQWYTMELVPGANLAQLVQREGPLTLERTVRLLDEALSALEQAHAQGLVHRDLKPENMLIEPDRRLRITDFRLALALRGDRFGGATSRSGTPQFAAPEQLLGERVDQRTDLYSLGAVAYFALLGRPPFEGATPEAILARQTTDDLPPLHASRGDVPREFEEVLRRAMTGDPAARYPSAQQFRQAVRKSQGFLRRLVVFLRGD